MIWQRQKNVIELKILYKSLEKTLAEGLSQTADYMDISGSDEGHLIIFDRNPNHTWDQKIFKHPHDFGVQKIAVWGM